MSDGLMVMTLLPILVAYASGLSLFFMLKDKFTSRKQD